MMERRDTLPICYHPTLEFNFMGNRENMLHALFNLFRKGLYYARKREQGRLILFVNVGETVCKLHVKDTGPGVDPEIHDKLFNDFVSRTPHGTGVGLSFCRRAMRLMGGDIHCESVSGEYADFILSFPLLTE